VVSAATVSGLGLISNHHLWIGPWNGNDVLGIATSVALAGIMLGGAGCILAPSRWLGWVSLALNLVAFVLGPSFMCA